MADTASYDVGATIPVVLWESLGEATSTRVDDPGTEWNLQDLMATYEPPIYSSLTTDVGTIVDGGRFNPLCPRANP